MAGARVLPQSRRRDAEGWRRFLDDAEHAQAEHEIQLGPGTRPVPYRTANTITPTMVVGDGAHVSSMRQPDTFR
jgi:hypothetical protein